MGFLKTYQEYAEAQTDAPSYFHIATGLSILSAAVGKNIWLWHGSIKIFPNLWAIILGESSFSRKTTSILIGKHLLSEWNNKVIMPDEFSPEALMANLVTNPTGIFFFYEFGSFLAALNRDYMRGTKETITDLYDYHKEHKRMLKGQSYVITEPCISILAGSTIDWFVKNFKEEDLQGGFLSRFIYFKGEKTKFIALPEREDMVKKETLRRELIYIGSIKGEMSFKDVREEYTDWATKYEAEHKSNQYFKPYSAFLTRLETYCKKICMLYALEDHTTTIRKEHFKKASSLIEILKWDFIKLYENELAFTKSDQKIKKIKKIIKEARDGIKRRDLLRATHLTSWEFEQIIKTLIETEEIIAKTIKNPRGENTLIYYYNVENRSE